MPTLTLPLSPGANRMWRTYRNVTVLSPEARQFKQVVATLARQAGACEPHYGEITVSMDYHPKARKKASEKPLRRTDLDAHIKPTLDALQGVAYLDDYQVVEVIARLAEPVPGGQLVVTWETR